MDDFGKTINETKTDSEIKAILEKIRKRKNLALVSGIGLFVIHSAFFKNIPFESYMTMLILNYAIRIYAMMLCIHTGKYLKGHWLIYGFLGLAFPWPALVLVFFVPKKRDVLNVK